MADRPLKVLPFSTSKSGIYYQEMNNKKVGGILQGCFSEGQDQVKALIGTKHVLILLFESPFSACFPP